MGLSQNADTADAGEGVGGSLILCCPPPLKTTSLLSFAISVFTGV